MLKLQTLAFRLAFTGNALISVFVFVFLFGAFPVKLLDTGWQATFSTILLDNSGFILVGLVLLWLAQYFDPDNQALSSHLRVLSRLCLVAALGFLLLVPLQFYISYKFVAATRQQEMYQYQRSARQVDFFAEKVKQAESFDDLQVLMKAYQSTQLPESERLKPLEVTKSLLLAKIKEAKNLLNSSRRPDLLRSKTGEQYKISLRNSFISLSYFFAFAALSQRRNSEHSLLQDIMEGFLNFLNSKLQRRENKLATDEPTDPTTLSVPSGDHRIESLHAQGLMDQAWLPDHESPGTDTYLSPESPEESVDTLPRRPGPFAWIRPAERRRRDDPTAFLETLSHQESNDQLGSSDGDPLANLLPGASQPEPAIQAQPPSQRRAGSMPSNRNKLTDLDYFEQLAGELDAEPEDDSSRPDDQTKQPPQSSR